MKTITSKKTSDADLNFQEIFQWKRIKFGQFNLEI